jgi:hypothetical protein
MTPWHSAESGIARIGMLSAGLGGNSAGVDGVGESKLKVVGTLMIRFGANFFSDR